jgi:hypothetical protein
MIAAASDAMKVSGLARVVIAAPGQGGRSVNGGSVLGNPAK